MKHPHTGKYHASSNVCRTYWKLDRQASLANTLLKTPASLIPAACHPMPAICGCLTSSHLDALAIDGDVGVVNDLDIGVEGAQGGVILQQMGSLLHTAGVVDGNNIQQAVGAALPAAQEVTADATKAVDGDLDLLLGTD